MLIKGRGKPESSVKKEELFPREEGTFQKSSVLKSHRAGRFAPKEEAYNRRENDPRRSLIKKGRLPYEPAPLFMPDASGHRGSIPGTSLHDSDLEISEEEALASSEEELEKLHEKAESSLADAKTEADRILAEAQAKAKKLIEQSKLYVQTAKSNAEREGFSEGKEKARAAALDELKGLMEKARDTLRQTGDLHENLARSMEGGLAKFAIKIAEKVIAREVSLDPDVVVAMVRSQLDKMKDRDHVIIHVNPEDYPNVKSKKELFFRFAPQVKSLEIQPDPRVDRGSCMVETNLGTVDATITTQLEAILLAFSKAERPEENEEVKGDAPQS